MNSSTTLMPVEMAARAETLAPLDLRSRTHKFCDWLRLMSGFAAYGLLGLVVIVACVGAAVTVPDHKRRRALCQRIIHRGVASYARYTEFAGIFRVEFPEINQLRKMRGTIFAPNHATLMDATHFLARLPQLVCVMKKSILSNPFMGISSALAGYLPMDQGSEFIRRGRDALREGGNLLVFPEGTRTIEPPVNSFKNGYALMALLAGAPVQTAFIEVPVLFMGKRWSAWKTPPLPFPIRITLGQQFHVEPGQSAKAFSAELEAYFRQELRPTASCGVERG